MNISVVIPNYNGEKILKDNLPKVIKSVLEYIKGSKEIIIIDDASTDTSLKILEEIKNKHSSADLKIIIDKNNHNLGFSSTVNKGVSLASAEIIILLNTDIIPESGFIDPLIRHFDDEKMFAVGCMDKSVEGEKTVLRGRGLGSWTRGLFIHSRGEVDKTNTLWVSGGSGAFRKQIWEKLGGLDPIYNPYYWEDIDLSYRAVKSGYKIKFEPESVVIHEHEKGSIKSQHSSKKVQIASYRNQFIFIWKNITQIKFLIQHVIWLPIHFSKAIIRRDYTYVSGCFDAFKKLPIILKSRADVRRQFTLTDSQVISNASVK